MGKIIDPVTNGHAAGKNGQELGIENELKMLECIKIQGWIREHELHLITGMSSYTVGQVSRRLADKNQIYRERFAGNAGYFLRLRAAGAERVDGKSGKDICIPASWPHHALAIQSLHYLAGVNQCDYETEASFRHRHQSGKLPDGRLVSDKVEFNFEQERSRKSGEALQNQSQNIVRLAAGGTICYVAYPYPASICGGINHELRQTNSIMKQLGSAGSENIKLVRCNFDSRLAYQNMHAIKFEVIDLPVMEDTAASVKDQSGFDPQINEFHWEMNPYRESNNQQCIRAILFLDGGICHECTFTEGMAYDDDHWLQSDYLGWDMTPNDKNQPFDDFVREQQKRIENQVKDKLERDIS